MESVSHPAPKSRQGAGNRRSAKRRVPGEGGIDQLPSGKWRARYRGPDGSRSTKTLASKSDASAWLRDQLSNIQRGNWVNPHLGKITFSEWVDDYLARSRKRPTTQSRDEVVLRTHFRPLLGSIPLSSITPSHIHQSVHLMESRLAPSTVRTNYAVLKAVFNAAVEAEIIVRSPCRGIHLRPDGRHDRRLLTPDELRVLAAAHPARYQAIPYLAGVLGLRWSEVAGLRVRNLDFFRKTVSVDSTIAEVNGVLVTADTKTPTSNRSIVAPDFIMTLLSQQLALRSLDGSDLDALVFVNGSGGPLRSGNFRNRVWKPAVTAAGLDGLTFHGLRHSAAALMVDAGLHPRVIQHRLGHATARLSMELYAHVSDDTDKRAAALLEENFNSLGSQMGHAEETGGA